MFLVSCSDKWNLSHPIELVRDGCDRDNEIASGDSVSHSSQSGPDLDIAGVFAADMGGKGVKCSRNSLGDEDSSSLFFHMGLNPDHPVQGAVGITNCSLVSNARIVEVYDGKDVYIDTVKGFAHTLPAHRKGEGPLFLIEVAFKTPLVFCHSTPHSLTLKLMSLKSSDTTGRLVPSAGECRLESVSVETCAVAAAPRSGFTGARPEDIFDLTSAVSSMNSMFAVGGAGSGDLHGNLLMSLMPSIIPGLAANHAAASVPGAQAERNSRNTNNSSHDPALSAAVDESEAPASNPSGSITVSSQELERLVDARVEARTALLAGRVQALESELAALSQAVSHLQTKETAKENYVVVDESGL